MQCGAIGHDIPQFGKSIWNVMRPREEVFAEDMRGPASCGGDCGCGGSCGGGCTCGGSCQGGGSSPTPTFADHDGALWASTPTQAPSQATTTRRRRRRRSGSGIDWGSSSAGGSMWASNDSAMESGCEGCSCLFGAGAPVAAAPTWGTVQGDPMAFAPDRLLPDEDLSAGLWANPAGAGLDGPAAWSQGPGNQGKQGGRAEDCPKEIKKECKADPKNCGTKADTCDYGDATICCTWTGVRAAIHPEPGCKIRLVRCKCCWKLDCVCCGMGDSTGERCMRKCVQCYKARGKPDVAAHEACADACEDWWTDANEDRFQEVAGKCVRCSDRLCKQEMIAGIGCLNCLGWTVNCKYSGKAEGDLAKSAPGCEAWK